MTVFYLDNTAPRLWSSGYTPPVADCFWLGPRYQVWQIDLSPIQIEAYNALVDRCPSGSGTNRVTDVQFWYPAKALGLPGTLRPWFNDWNPDYVPLGVTLPDDDR